MFDNRTADHKRQPMALICLAACRLDELAGSRKGIDVLREVGHYVTVVACGCRSVRSARKPLSNR